MSDLQNLRSWSRKQGAPFTIGLVASLVVAMLANWLTRSQYGESLQLQVDSLKTPWSLLTYAWLDAPYRSGLDLFFFACLMGWLFVLGGSLEREIGWKRSGGLWVASVLAVGVSMLIGMTVLNINLVYFGAYLPTSVVTMVWCAKNKTSVIQLYGVFPLSGRWLAVVDAVASMLVIGTIHPILGLFAIIPMPIAYFLAAGQFPQLWSKKVEETTHATRAQTRYGQEYYDDVDRRARERDERDRLKKLFESSLDDDAK